MRIIQQILNLPLIIKIIIIVFIYFKFFRRENFFGGVDINKLKIMHQQKQQSQRTNQGIFSNIINFFNKPRFTQQSNEEKAIAAKKAMAEKKAMAAQKAEIDTVMAAQKAEMEKAMAAKEVVKKEAEKLKLESALMLVTKKTAELGKVIATGGKTEEKTLQQAQKKLIEASKENIKSKIEEKKSELLKIKGNKREAEKATLKSLTALKEAIKKTDEAQVVINKIEKSKSNKYILPIGTKKGQILKWDGTKWALGTDNIF